MFDLLITLLFIQFIICVTLHVTCFHVFPKSFKEAFRMCWLPWVLRNLKNIEKEDKEFSFGRKNDGHPKNEMEKKQARKEKSKLGNVKKTETKLLNILLPKELIDTVNTFCSDKDITIQEFVTDAMIEKLRFAYKEKPKDPRL
jgi:NRPS condensation-like uncharacterized protein